MTKVLQTFTFFIVLILLATAGFGAWIWQEMNHKIDHPNAERPIAVVRGERLDQILQTLQDRGIMNQTLPLRIYLKVTRAEPLVKAGIYWFPSPISPLEVIEYLKKGGVFQRFTVIEGWTRFEIADALVKVPTLKLQNRAQAMQLLNNSQLIKDLDPTAKNLEGYLFPDTYLFLPDTTPQELVKQMVQRFRQVWSERIAKEAAQRKRSVHGVVTQASLIETEAKLKAERPVIASVMENRVKRKMTLSMDSTLIYAAKIAGTWKNDGKIYQSDIDRASPYNTRHIKGLPPGPIASPGLSSLEAAVNPASTNFVFYVRNPDRNDGAHNFYADTQSFEVGVKALRDWEQKHPAARR